MRPASLRFIAKGRGLLFPRVRSGPIENLFNVSSVNLNGKLHDRTYFSLIVLGDSSFYPWYDFIFILLVYSFFQLLKVKQIPCYSDQSVSCLIGTIIFCCVATTRIQIKIKDCNMFINTFCLWNFNRYICDA